MGWDREGTMSHALNGSHLPPGIVEVTILLIATLYKLIRSVYIYQSSCPTAEIITPRYQGRFFCSA